MRGGGGGEGSVYQYTRKEKHNIPNISPQIHAKYQNLEKNIVHLYP